MKKVVVIILLSAGILRANTIFYNVNFNSDPLNQPPLTDSGTNEPTGRFNDFIASPIVVPSFGQLTNRPVLFTNLTLSTVGFELARGTPDYTLDFDFESHNVTSNEGLIQISFVASDYVGQIDDALTPEVFFELYGNGQMTASDGQNYSLGWNDDQVHHLHVVVGIGDGTNYLWTIQLDTNEPITGSGPNDVGDFSGLQLSLGSLQLSNGTNTELAIDNIVIGTTTNFVPLVPIFSFSESSGGEPQGGVVRDSAGNLYGTTVSAYSGTNPAVYGTVFKMDTNGKLTWSFPLGNTNGAYPAAALTLASDGFLYGTAVAGGNGYGTIFKISRNGKLAWSVPFNGTNGQAPRAGLTEVRGRNGGIELYGTATQGGAEGNGTVFKLDASRKIQVLHSFTNGVDGASPACRLAAGDDGNLYGTTGSGGDGNGAVFKVSPNGQFTNIFAFDGTNGATPTGGLTKFGKDTFYGTTAFGGTNSSGIFFRITSSGALTTLHSFGQELGASHPNPELLPGRDGNFYGTTYTGGTTNFYEPYGYGTIFRISPAGEFQKLADFHGGDGAYPEGPMAEVETGRFYGTASETEGSPSGGTVFRVFATRPAVVIDGPTSAAIRSGELEITGKTKCDAPVTNVFCNLNGGGWLQATTTNAWSTWSGTADLAHGRNTVQAYAVSAFGDRSRTNTLRFGR